MADPGIPAGGCRPRGVVPTPSVAASWNFYVKMKELGPLWGGILGAPPASINVNPYIKD